MLSQKQQAFLLGMTKAIDETFNPPAADKRLIVPDTWGFSLFMWKIGEDFEDGTCASNREHGEIVEMVKTWLDAQPIEGEVLDS